MSLDARVRESLRIARDVRRWWNEARRTRAFDDWFPLVRAFNRPVSAFGFLSNRGPSGLGLMGLSQTMLYDDLSPHHGPRSAAQLGEFVLRYFLRVSDFRVPEAWVAETDAGGGRSALSWCPSSVETFRGFGYSQHAFGRLDGTTGRFSESESHQIVDLRELGRRYAWIVARVRIFDFNLSVRPFGPRTPAIQIPLDQSAFVVLAPDFVVCRERPSPGVEAEFGLGYALLRHDEPGGFLAYGPGQFAFGVQTLTFELLSTGQVCVRMTFVVNRPEALVRVPLDPVRWAWAAADLVSAGVASAMFPALREWMLHNTPDADFDPVLSALDLANALTAGAADRDLCLSREQLERRMLLQHFTHHYEMITGSLATWRRFPDWTDEASLPAWVVQGRAA